MSRPSLREALDKLVDLNLLTTDANGASYVSDAIGRSLRDPLVVLLQEPEARMEYLEFRNIIEGAAAEYAARRASDIDRQAIGHHFERMRAARARDDSDEHAKADADFHLAIYEASHNIVLLHIMRSMETMLRSDVYLNRRNLYEHRGEKDSLFEQHQAIYEAIMARDPVAARAAAQHHMSHTLDTLREMREAEKRLEMSIRRLDRNNLIAAGKKTRQPRAS